MNKYQLFLDDLRDVHTVYPDYQRREHWNRIIVVRSVEDAQALIREMGYLPSFISFDNDLGTELEGKDLAKWIIEQVRQGTYQFDPRFDFNVHSANVCAAKDIESLMNNFLAFGDKVCKHNVPLTHDCHPCYIDLPTGWD